MKKIISLLICLVLLMSIGVCAYSTNIDAIEPDTNVYIIGVTDKEVPIIGSLYTYYDGSSLIIIPQ